MELFTQHGKPGMQIEQDAFTASPLFFTEHHWEMSRASRPALLKAASVDPGNTPTTTIRGGWILTQDSNGLFEPLAGSASPAIAILDQTVNMLENGVAVNRFVRPFIKGNVRYGEVLNINPLRARQLAARGFVFDRREFNTTGGTPSQVLQVATSTTLGVVNNGALAIVTDTATVTLPTPSFDNEGLFYFVTKATANTVTVNSTGTNTMVLANGTLANTQTVASGTVRYECAWVGGSTYRWVRTN